VGDGIQDFSKLWRECLESFEYTPSLSLLLFGIVIFQIQSIMNNGGKCPCCGLYLEYPNNIAAYRCTICLCVTDLNPVPAPSDQSDIFTSPILSQQFFKNGTSSESFDMILMRSVFAKILDKDIADVDLVLSNIKSMVIRPGRRLVTILDIRFLFCVLEFLSLYKLPNPLVFEIRFRVFGLIANLPNYLHMAFVGWLEELLTDEEFTDRVNQTNNTLTRLLLSNLDNFAKDWRIKGSVQVMSILLSANTARGGRYEFRVPLATFYICYKWSDTQNLPCILILLLNYLRFAGHRGLA
jgi:hypothetical protein